MKNYGSGITSIIDYNYLLNKYELNKIEMETKNFLNNLFESLFNPFAAYQVRYT